MDYSLLIGVKKERFEVMLPGSMYDQVSSQYLKLFALEASSILFQPFLCIMCCAQNQAPDRNSPTPGTPSRNTVRDSGVVTLSAPYGRITDHARGRSMSSRGLSVYEKGNLCSFVAVLYYFS